MLLLQILQLAIVDVDVNVVAAFVVVIVGLIVVLTTVADYANVVVVIAAAFLFIDCWETLMRKCKGVVNNFYHQTKVLPMFGERKAFVCITQSTGYFLSITQHMLNRIDKRT